MFQATVSRNVHCLAAFLLGFVGFLSFSYIRQETTADPIALAAQPTKTYNQKVQPTSFLPARREMMSGLGFAFATALAKSDAAKALSNVDIKDARGAKDAGFDIIYEARDLGLPQGIRDGLTQARTSDAGTKGRIQESKVRLGGEVLENIKNSYWPGAANALRRQLGTLRFDLKSIADLKDAAGKKQMVAANKEFLTTVEKLDYSIRSKQQDEAVKLIGESIKALDVCLKLA
jgi:photosystem II oxygen-evolving enhancer protein 3